MHARPSLNITLIETIKHTCKGTVQKQPKKQYKKGDYAAVLIVRLHILKTFVSPPLSPKQTNHKWYILVQLFCFVCQSLVPGVIHTFKHLVAALLQFTLRSVADPS